MYLYYYYCFIIIVYIIYVFIILYINVCTSRTSCLGPFESAGLTASSGTAWSTFLNPRQTFLDEIHK